MAENVTAATAEGSLRVPKNMLRYAGPSIGVAGSLMAVLAFLGRDTRGALQLLGQFGPKYLFWAFFVSLIYSLLRLLIKMIGKLGQQLVDHFGQVAINTGSAAIALSEGAAALKVQSQQTAADRHEMELQVGYVAQHIQTVAREQVGITRALMRIEDKLGVTPEAGSKV